MTVTLTTKPEHRHWLREELQPLSSIERVQVCGRYRVDTERGVPVYLSPDGERAHFGNVQSCASVHACPHCAAKIRQKRAQEVAEALERHLERGGGALMATMTVPHHRGQALADLLKVIARSWKRTLGGRRFVQLAGDLGYVGSIKAFEVDHGPNGWHPHLHVLLLFDAPLRRRARGKLWRHLFNEWSASAAREGLGEVVPEGVHVSRVRNASDASFYTTKAAGLEMTRHDLKGKRRDRPDFGLRSVWRIATELVSWGDTADLSLWWEYEEATRGKRALVWSRGLKSRLLVEETTDDEIVVEQAEGECIAIIGGVLWNIVVKKKLRALVLRVAREHGADGLSEWLARLEDDYLEPSFR